MIVQAIGSIACARVLTPFNLIDGQQDRPLQRRTHHHVIRYAPFFHEDSHSSPHMNEIDARRIEDDIKVTLKRVPTTTKELPIARYLSSEALLPDPRNRTVRILDVIPLPDDDEWAMPYLRQFDPVLSGMPRIFRAIAPGTRVHA
ncbi:hypothetical protein JB92DRAFT_2913977 [Gautieria morchelliformis]|nr:hypothetical protein JB92DRAFT_2913977 [Gautieria morchelliformis]